MARERAGSPLVLALEPVGWLRVDVRLSALAPTFLSLSVLEMESNTVRCQNLSCELRPQGGNISRSRDRRS